MLNGIGALGSQACALEKKVDSQNSKILGLLGDLAILVRRSFAKNVHQIQNDDLTNDHPMNEVIR